MALLALSTAFLLSPPGTSVWARFQSPVSPVSPLPSQPAQALTPSPSIPGITPTPASEALAPPETRPSQTGGDNTAMLVAGGIVLIGLVAGAVVLLMRGQPSDESES
ncbi:MAG: hypothetical protein JSV81_05420 [Anaerolineales bacterium]|nr:MAG: hypothetical protein JSV81_05420 [Anaerolineales bacterium]